MPDDTSAQAATDDAAAQAAADTTTQDTTTDTGGDTQQDTNQDTNASDGAAAALKKANSEAASYRKQLRDVQAELKKHQDAQLSDQEKLTKRAAESEAKVAELEQKARAATLRAEITAAAAKAGVTDVTDATLLLPSVGQVEYDDDGQPTNVADLVTKLVEAKPYLTAGADGEPPRDARTQRTSPAAPRRSGGGGKFSRQQVEALTQEQWRTLSADDHSAAMAALAGQ